MKSPVLCFLVVAIALGEKQIENWKVDTFGDKNFVQVDQNDSFTGPIVRKKRFVGVTLLTIGLIASATATAVSTIDQETDSEAFYPSIRTHKNTIRFYARRIQEKVPSLQRQVRNIEDKLQIARNTERNMNQWLTTMSKIKNLTEVHNLQLEDTDFVIPASVSNQIPLFNKIMTPVSYAFLGLQTYGTVQAVSSAVAGTLSATSAAFTGIGGVLAIVGSGVTIGITLNNGANKRDQYRDIATNYQAQFERLDEADRNLTALWTNFRTFMIDIQNKVEAIVTEDLRTTCSVGVHGEAIPDLVQALDSNWITILNGFIHLDEKYRQIKQQINFQIDNGATAQETFLGIYRNHRDQSAFIIDAMKQAGIAENTFGRWGPWRNRTPCTETDCGVRMKTRNRRCLTGSCIGNTFQKVVCSVNRDREESCDAMPTSTIPTYINTRAYSYYSAVIKHICALSTDYVQYQGMNDAFTVRPTATVQQPHAITW
eukprot:GFUD01005877.1.p1 GENE.GFUD01005877.1~~GFUD01005877.1.p1  ORF type:complete len:484 (-),score=97.98 GFUD01005877.1:88-1539(-)